MARQSGGRLRPARLSDRRLTRCPGGWRSASPRSRPRRRPARSCRGLRDRAEPARWVAGFAASLAAHQAVLFATSFVLGSGEGFTAAAVGGIATLNVIWAAGLALVFRVVAAVAGRSAGAPLSARRAENTGRTRPRVGARVRPEKCARRSGPAGVLLCGAGSKAGERKRREAARQPGTSQTSRLAASLPLRTAT